MTDSATLRSHYGTWGEHPDFPSSDWQDEVADDATRLGYWDWVEAQIDALEDSND